MGILVPRRRTRRSAAVIPAAVVLFLTAAGTLRAGADGVALDEYQVKAAFLFNFAKFVEWPAEAGSGAADSLSLCILGHNPFGSALDSVAGKRVGTKTFVVREISNTAEAAQCQILFMAASERKREKLVLPPLKGSSVLTVGETDEFLSDGGMIAFKLKDARVSFEINPAAAERAKLHISSKLLSLGESAKR